MLYENGEFERIRPHLTPLECGIIFDGIPEGAISRKVGLIWGIPVRYVYMLESPPGGGDLLPRESAHAHNFFIHYGVESGVLGLNTRGYSW